jgi:pyridoxal phosphate phosphatase PHOSPHO2
MKVLVAFDFDWTLIDSDSDRFTVTELHPQVGQQMDELKRTIQWTDLMNHLYHQLHSHGIRPDQIKETISKLPMSEHVVNTLKFLKDQIKADIFIVSDANTFFIEELLRLKGLRECIDGIITNPAFFDEHGRLHIERMTKPSDPPHGCLLGTCAPNICKGKEIKLLTLKNAYDVMVYVGDGRNDYCPSTKLRKDTDYVLCRRGRGLENLLLKGTAMEDADGLHATILPHYPRVEATIKYWDTGKDMHDIFQEIFKSHIQK